MGNNSLNGPGHDIYIYNLIVMINLDRRFLRTDFRGKDRLFIFYPLVDIIRSVGAVSVACWLNSDFLLTSSLSWCLSNGDGINVYGGSL